MLINEDLQKYFSIAMILVFWVNHQPVCMIENAFMDNYFRLLWREELFDTTPQVSLPKWLNYFNWGCSWHTGSVILQNSSYHSIPLIFKNIGPSKVLMNDLLLLVYWRRILSLLFIETLGKKEFKLLFHDGMINTSCIGKILLYTRHKLLAFNAWHTSIILLLTAYCAGNLFPTWCCKSKATAKV